MNTPPRPDEWENHEWVTARQAANYLQVHPRTVQRWVRAGVIPATRVGGRLRILRTSVEGLLGSDAPPMDGD